MVGRGGRSTRSRSSTGGTRARSTRATGRGTGAPSGGCARSTPSSTAILRGAGSGCSGGSGTARSGAFARSRRVSSGRSTACAGGDSVKQGLVEADRDRMRKAAVVPAYNEEASIGAVVAEIRAFDPGFEVVVVDDGSTDATAELARRAGATVLSLPYNLGIGAAVQTGLQYAAENDFDLAVQIDGDDQHDSQELEHLLVPVLSGRADFAVGTRFAGERRYRASVLRRIGIVLFAGVVSLIVRQRVTDTTSGFRAMNRRAIRLFAADYPHDYPEVEATVLVYRHGLRLVEVPVAMRRRENGRSSITPFRSLYYMGKVSLALFVGLLRPRPALAE